MSPGLDSLGVLMQKLESGMSDVVSLDGGRISSKGITSGSGFRVAPLAEAPCRFGSSHQAQAVDPAQLQQQVQHWCRHPVCLVFHIKQNRT